MTVIRQFNTDTDTWEAILVGETGPTGDTGPTGADGATGSTGPQGNGVQLRGSYSGTDTALPVATGIGETWVIGGPVPTLAPARDDGDAQRGDGMVWTEDLEWVNFGPLRGPAGIGAGGTGLPTGGSTGQVLAKFTSADYDVEWTAPEGGVGVTDGDKGDIVVSDSGASWAIDSSVITAAARTVLDDSTTALMRSTLGAANELLTVAGTAPLNGGGTLTGNVVLGIDTFAGSAIGVVPTSVGGTVNFLRADGSWATPPGSMSGIGNTATFVYNTTTTEPPIGNQLRTNNAAFASATRVWIMETTADGLDVSLGLARIKAGYQLYIQDRDNAANYALYSVVSSTDDGTYWDYTVTYVTGTGTIPAGTVEIQAVAPGLTVVAASATVSGIVELATTAEATAQTDTVRAVTPAGLADRVKTGYTITATTPLTIGGGASADLSANRTIAVGAASDTAAGVVELATAAEVLTGTDTTRAVTAAGATGAFSPRYLSINTQTGTSYTLVLTDDGKLISLSNAAAIALSVPTNASVPYPVGTQIPIAQFGAGQVSVAAVTPGTTTVNATPGLKLRAQSSGATLVKTATDVWYLFGDLSA